MHSLGKQVISSHCWLFHCDSARNAVNKCRRGESFGEGSCSILLPCVLLNPVCSRADVGAAAAGNSSGPLISSICDKGSLGGGDGERLLL